VDTITAAAPAKKKKKQRSRSLFYRISAWLHLWLGLVTGIIMVIVCLLACIWVFNEEITNMLEPETRVEWQNKPVLTPSQLMDIAKQQFPKKKPGYVMYHQGRAVFLSLGEGRRGNTTLRVNPYTGEVVRVKVLKEGETDFFRWVLNGHRFLWLPYGWGRPVVNYSTLIFTITLITGLILWWPQKWNKNSRQQSFTIKWGASFKRVNYDLHNVLGFYSMIVVLAMCLTGMVYGIEWYSKGLYWVTSGGQTLPDFKRLQSDSLQQGKMYTTRQAMDLAFRQVMASHPEAKGFYYSFADSTKPKSTIGITVYPSVGKYYNNKSYAFDQHTLQPLEGNKVYEADFSEAPFGTKLRKMNYDIHIGAILGLPGKIMAFFGALIGATLPVTGFLVWWGRRNKKSKKTK
jgi:uncharacterized iron-regulated membrane protein